MLLQLFDDRLGILGSLANMYMYYGFFFWLCDIEINRVVASFIVRVRLWVLSTRAASGFMFREERGLRFVAEGGDKVASA